jgi:hypothetical protein
MGKLNVHLNMTRSALPELPPERQLAEARLSAKMFLIPLGVAMTDTQVPDDFVTDEMAHRYLALSPPLASVIPEFQTIVNEIEKSYVLGLFFSALSAACVATERMLNLARIQLHPHQSPKIKELWGKGPSNGWEENIDALLRWGYIADAFAAELNDIYTNIRCRYLHSGAIGDMAADALRAAGAAYRLLKIFLGIPNDVTGFDNGAIVWTKPGDPRIQVFYEPQVQRE